MKLIVYGGIYSAVDVREVTFVKGVPLPVSDVLAADLLRNSEFSEFIPQKVAEPAPEPEPTPEPADNPDDYPVTFPDSEPVTELVTEPSASE